MHIHSKSLVAGLCLALVLHACGDTDSIEHGDAGGADADTDLGELDPRCASLCTEDDATCSAEVASCEDVCQVRVAGVSAICATCLLESSNGGACDSGGSCCPDPDFPSSVVDCTAACADSDGVNPAGTHPACADLCASDDASCDADSAGCLDECQARITGVTGLCATCLLEDANGGACGGGGPCCPDPEFPTTASDCAGVCGG